MLLAGRYWYSGGCFIGLITPLENKAEEDTMANNKIPPEKYFDLVELGYVRPVVEHVDLAMPSLYRTVPTGLVYNIAVPQSGERVRVNAKLERRPRRNKKKK